MKIEITKYIYPKTIGSTKTIELNDKNNTYIKGRSGGSNYVACIIPIYYPVFDKDYKTIIDQKLGSFTFISSTSEREGRVNITLSSLSDEVWFKSELKNLPHGEDIINYFLKIGEGYEHNICTEEYFNNQIKQWRII